jgi:phosphoribosyl 1,2-cyclic phosphate phosphodiesterase
MKITFMGTGTSHGVPSIDCMVHDYNNCPKKVCKEAAIDKKHSRTRTSILVEIDSKSILVDVSADFRQQMLRESVKRIDAVLITHGHADHIGGIPDIRSYTINAPLTLYGSEECIETVRNSFSYIFDPHTFVGGGIPRIETSIVKNPFELFGQTIIPVRVEHGRLKGTFGYRIGPLAYIPDMKRITDQELTKLIGAEVLVINCLRLAPEHTTHLTLSESIAIARKIGPRKCYFTHMCHDIHYVTDSKELESWMMFAYDGLQEEI